MAVKIPPIHVDAFNPVAHAAGDLPLESLENLAEDLAQKGFKGKGFVAEFLKKHEWFLGQRKLTLPATMAIAAMLAKVGQKFGMGSTLSAILYEVVKHVLAGASEGAYDAVHASKEEKKAAWEKEVDEKLELVRDDKLPALSENEFMGRIRKGDSVIHATNEDCSIVMGFTDGHEAGSKNRDKIVLTAFSAGNKGGGKRGKGDDDGGGAGLVVKELKGDEKRVEYHSGNIADLLRRGNTFLCKLCYPDGAPKDAPHGEKHGHAGLKDKFGEKAVDVFLAANATIATMGIGKLFAIDEIQEWKDVDPDLMKAMAERLHPNIVDGKLPRADLEELLTLIPTSGVEKLSAVNAVGKLYKSAKEFLGESPKKDEKPLLEEYSLELVNFLRASERFYESGFKVPFWSRTRTVRKLHQQEHAHLKDVLKLPDLTELDELARAIWTSEVRDGGFKDEAQFLAWSSAVKTLVKAHELDQERKHPTLRKVGRIGLTLYKASGYAFLAACALFVLGWCFAGFYAGAMVAGFAGLTALILTVFLSPISGALSVLDWFLKDKNKMDDFVRGVQSTLVIYFASMMVLVWLLYACHFPAPTYIAFFTVLTGCTIAASFGLKKAQAFTTLQNNLKLVSLVFGGIYGVILIGGIIGASFGLFNVNVVPKLQDVGADVNAAMNDESDEDEDDEPAATTGAVTTNGQDPLEAAKQRARELKGAAPATSPSAQQDGSGAAKKLTKPQIQAEIAQAEKKLKQEFGDNVPALPELEKRHKELAKQLTALRQQYEANNQLEDMTKDPAYQPIEDELKVLAGKINLRKQVADLTKQLNTKDPAPQSVASNATVGAGAKAEDEDGLKAYCRGLKEKAPLVYAQVPNCQGV